MKISFVIPCYHSSKTIDCVVNEIWHEMKRTDVYQYEIILVNDGSSDMTFEAIQKLCRQDSRITGINLTKNFGQHAALMAGFRYVSGDVIVCLDDDGQTPVDELHKLMTKIADGYDVVYAEYEDKKHSVFRNIGSRINMKMTESMLGKPKELYISSYFAAKRFVIEEIKKYRNPYPYIIGLVLRTTKNICSVKVMHRPRTEGASGYSLQKLVALWLNGFTSFSVKPLRIATVCGVAAAISGLCYAVWIIMKKLLYPMAPIGWSSAVSIMLIMGGMILLVLGMIGEYIGRIYICMNHAPQYVIKEIVSDSEKDTFHMEIGSDIDQKL